MHGFVLLFCLQIAVKFKFAEGYDGLIQALTNVFAQKNVQTVTASTCWLPGNVEKKKKIEKLLKKKRFSNNFTLFVDANSRLVFGLSSVDISVSFHRSVVPVYHTWYSQGILVDVSCARTANALFQQVKHGTIFGFFPLHLYGPV